MSLASFPITAFGCKMFHEARSSCIPSLNPKIKNKNLIERAEISRVILSPLFCQNLIWKSFSTRRWGLSVAAFCAGNPGPAREDKRALETVLKLYTAIRNRDINELSDIIGEECQCVCNFISMFKPFQGKKQVMEFFSALMKSLGNNIQFVVQPTMQDGMIVGVSWKLEWSQTHVPIGKGFSFIICHVYQGKVLIRNVEMFMEPLVHLEPLRLKLMGFVMNVMDKISLHEAFRGKARRAVIYLLLVLSLVIGFLLFT